MYYLINKPSPMHPIPRTNFKMLCGHRLMACHLNPASAPQDSAGNNSTPAVIQHPQCVLDQHMAEGRSVLMHRGSISNTTHPPVEMRRI